MLLRCPACDTPHELDEALFVKGPRRVRCASCREIWQASPPADQDTPPDEASSPTDGPAPEVSWEMEAPEGASVSQADLDAMFNDPPAPETPPEEAQPAEAAAPEPEPEPEKPAEDLKSGKDEKPAKKRKVERDDDRPAMEVVERPAIMFDTEALPDFKKRAEFNNDPKVAERALHEDAPPPNKAIKAATTLLTCLTGVAMAFVVFRHDVVRVAPATGPLFEKVGLGVNLIGLEIHKVKSQMLYEDGRETLEVIGEIVNVTSAPVPVPILRLSLRNSAGQEVYVWTGSADKPNIAAKEKTSFRRRLVAPPADAASVMVRFIARDDIVASVQRAR